MEDKALFKDIRRFFPHKAIDLYKSLELLQRVLSETINEISSKTSKNVLERKFHELNRLSVIAEQLSNYEEKLIQILSQLELDSNQDLSIDNGNEEKRDLPNYDEYAVNHRIEHTLYENFTHIRPYGFRIINNDKIVEAKTWQEMLTKICEFLLAVDREKFFSFKNNNNMNGKKNKYFSHNESLLRKPGSVNGEIFIELNQSSNSIRNLIIKLLQEYDFRISDFKVYFRADYTDLNHEGSDMPKISYDNE